LSTKVSLKVGIEYAESAQAALVTVERRPIHQRILDSTTPS